MGASFASYVYKPVIPTCQPTLINEAVSSAQPGESDGLDSRAAEHKGCNWGTQLTFGCSLELCSVALSVVSSGICQIKSQFYCMTLSRWPCLEYHNNNYNSDDLILQRLSVY